MAEFSKSNEFSLKVRQISLFGKNCLMQQSRAMKITSHDSYKTQNTCKHPNTHESATPIKPWEKKRKILRISRVLVQVNSV